MDKHGAPIAVCTSKTLAGLVRDFVYSGAATVSEDVVRTRWVCAVCPGFQQTETQVWIKCIWSVRAQATLRSPMSLCGTKSLCEVMRLLTFGFSITKYSHAEELQHPDGMMNSLNQPQDVIVSTRKALDLCLD